MIIDIDIDCKSEYYPALNHEKHLASEHSRRVPETTGKPNRPGKEWQHFSEVQRMMIKENDAVYEKGQLYWLPVETLYPDPNQPRKSIDADALAELAASIAQHGILQPLLFRVGINDIASGQQETSLIIVAGERRFKAAAMVGLSEVPAIFVGDSKAGEISLIENLQRQDLTCIEEAEALEKLMTDANYTQIQLSVVIGKPAATLSDTLSLTKLPEEIRNECRADRRLTKKSLLEIARKTQKRAMFTAYNKLRKQMDKTPATHKPAQPKLSPKESVLKMLADFVKKTENVDTSGWSQEEMAAVRHSLTNLIDSLESLVARAHNNIAAE